MKQTEPLAIELLAIAHLASGATPTADEWQQLEAVTLQDQFASRAFCITPENVGDVLKARSHLLQQIYPVFQQFCQQRFQSPPLNTLWNVWLPLASQLAQHRQKLNRPFIQGILGGQGTGKTTLGAVLTLILQQLGYKTLSLSLDDLYKTHADRQQLQEQDPRLIWRGPPGTHDVELGLQVLDQLQHSNHQSTIAIPRFDKSLHNGSGDRLKPEPVESVDIVLFEGWFVGVYPIDPILFDQAPEPITTPDDRAFARDMNAKLQDYVLLWQRLDSLIVLYPTDYRFSKQWRQQAEAEMKAHGKPGMNEAEIDAFVDYFWKALHPTLFIQPLISQPNGANLVIEIQQDHSIGKIYSSCLKTP